MKSFATLVIVIAFNLPAAAQGLLGSGAIAAPLIPIAESGDVGAVLKRLRELNAEMADKLDRSLAEAERSAPIIERKVLELKDELSRRAPQLQQEIENLLRRLEQAAQPAPRTLEI